MGAIIIILLILIGLVLALMYYDPVIEKVSFRGYKETRLWYNVWSKCKDKDVFDREYVVLYKKKIK